MELIKMTRGTDTANVRPEWVEDWEAQGWEIEGDKKPAAGDDLESMTLDELKELAKSMGVNIHANSGADKFIEAIRASGNAGATE